MALYSADPIIGESPKPTNPLRHIEYLGYLLKHKYHTYDAGREIGLDPIQLLAHDLSKLSPTEFGPYADFFYGRPGIPKVRTPEFQAAVEHHRKSNAHHYFTGVPEIKADPTLGPKMVPLNYRAERIADWWGVGKARGTNKSPDFKTWWASYKKPPVDEEVINYIDNQLGLPMGLHKEAATQSKADIVMEKQPGNKVGYIAGNKPVKDVQNQPKMVSPSKPQRGPAPIASSHPNHIQAQVEATTTNNDKFTNLTTPEEIKK